MKLTSQQQIRLQQCLAGMQDENLLPDESFWVNQLLETCAEARVIYIQSLHIAAHLNWDFGITPGSADYPEEKLILGEPPNPKLLKDTLSKPSEKQSEKENPSYFSQKQKMALWIVTPSLLLIVTVVSWMGIYHLAAPFFFKKVPQQPAIPIATSITPAAQKVAVIKTISEGELRSKETLFVVNDHLKTGKQFHLEKGLLEIEMNSGAKVVIAGPTIFQLMDSNTLHLLHGTITANVPHKAIGFTVNTPRGRIVDLGTVFSVHATKDLNTIVQVFRGKVIASLLDQQGGVQSSKKVKENKAVKIDVVKEEMTNIPYSSNNFIASIQKEHGIAQHSETVVFHEKMPEPVVAGKYQVYKHSDLVYLFPEKRNVLLSKPLTVEIGKPGVYQTDEDILKGESVISAGTTVDCFHFFYYPAAESYASVFIQGEVRFDRPVLGIVFENKKMLEVDQLFYLRFLKEGKNNKRYQGLEISKGTTKKQRGHDKLTLSEDRKVLSFDLEIIGESIDEFRVILQSQKGFSR